MTQTEIVIAIAITSLSIGIQIGILISKWIDKKQGNKQHLSNHKV